MSDEKRSEIIAFLVGILPVSYFALLVAPYRDKGLWGVMEHMDTLFSEPIHFQGNSLRTVIIFLFIYALLFAIYLSSKRNYRKGVEYGSAKWATAGELAKKYAASVFKENKILTQGVWMSYDTHAHRRNMNVMVIGGSGAGKTRSFVIPNVLQCNSSFFVLDCKGEIVRATGKVLESEGYEIRVLDLVEMEKSHCYNPFSYIRKEEDVTKLVSTLFAATTPKDAVNNDPFWTDTAKILLKALMYYLWLEAPEEEQNFATVMHMLRAGMIVGESDKTISPLDYLFMDLEAENPDHPAVKAYKNYHSGSAKTLKSIQITLASRLEAFDLDALASMTATDELDIGTLGTKKKAVFAVIPDNDKSFNFLVSILYLQMFQELYYISDRDYQGELPMPVHLVMDEFNNVQIPPDFEQNLATMRGRGISVSIILQNLAQLKAKFKDEWESIQGNCDSVLYLGGNESSTHKYISEALGKETIDTNSYGRSQGRGGSYTTNYQMTGRELLTPDEVRKLDNRNAILLIRGEGPVMDKKYDLMKHPRIGETLYCGSPAYIYGEVKDAKATIDITSIRSLTYDEPYEVAPETGYTLLSDEEILREFKLVNDGGNENEGIQILE